MPPMPEGAQRRHPQGHVPAAGRRRRRRRKLRAQLLGSGAILNEALEAQEILAEKYGVGRRRLERHQLQGALPRRPRLRALEPAASRRDAARALRHASACKDAPGVFVAASRLPEGAAATRSPAGCRGRLHALGTDGFGRSESRARAARLLRGRRALRRLATLHRWRARARSRNPWCSAPCRNSASIPRNRTRPSPDPKAR